MHRILILAGVLAVPVAAVAAAACAARGGIDERVITDAVIDSPYTVDVDHPGDVVITRSIVAPGAGFGWHGRRAAAVVVVKGGTLTLYDGADATCTPQRIEAEHGFVEQAGHVYLARNESHSPVDIVVTYLGLERGVDPDVPSTGPGGCPTCAVTACDDALGAPQLAG
jgi:hypothetical protein